MLDYLWWTRKSGCTHPCAPSLISRQLSFHQLQYLSVLASVAFTVAFTVILFHSPRLLCPWLQVEYPQNYMALTSIATQSSRIESEMVALHQNMQSLQALGKNHNNLAWPAWSQNIIGYHHHTVDTEIHTGKWSDPAVSCRRGKTVESMVLHKREA